MNAFGDISGYRGHMVVDSAGRKLGRLEQIHLSGKANRPAWGRVVLGKKHTFVPLIGASAAGDRVEIAYEKKVVVDAPHGDGNALLQYYLRVGQGMKGLGALGPPPDWP